MDPIEKILSELAPPPAPGDLDRAMARILDRADRRVRRVSLVRGAVAMSVVFLLGLGAGSALTRREPAQATPKSVTYILPMSGMDLGGSGNSLVSGGARLGGDADPAIEVVYVDMASTTRREGNS